MGSAVHVDFAPAARPADEKENAVSPVILDEVDAVRCVESPWTAIPGTPWMRIVLSKAELPCQEQGTGPRFEWCNLVDDGGIHEKKAVELDGFFHQGAATAGVPVTSFSRCGPQIHCSIW